MTDGPQQQDLWPLLREHAAWVSQEKQIIWRRFAASVTALSFYFTGSVIALGRQPPTTAFLIAAIGGLICVLFLLQTSYGWHLQDRRLRIIAELQGEISADHLRRWPLAFRPRDEQPYDWIKLSALAIIVAFGTSFVALAGTAAFRMWRCQ